MARKTNLLDYVAVQYFTKNGKVESRAVYFKANESAEHTDAKAIVSALNLKGNIKLSTVVADLGGDKTETANEEEYVIKSMIMSANNDDGTFSHFSNSSRGVVSKANPDPKTALTKVKAVVSFKEDNTTVPTKVTFKDSLYKL